MFFRAPPRDSHARSFSFEGVKPGVMRFVSKSNRHMNELRNLMKKVKESIKKILPKNVLKGLSDSEFKNSPEGKLGHI